MLALSLASGKTVEAAAKDAGITPRTVFRRLDEPLFVKLVEQTRAEMFAQALGKLAAAAEQAVDTLTELLSSSQPAATRRGAARDLLELGRHMRESVELEARIAALEQLDEDLGGHVRAERWVS